MKLYLPIILALNLLFPSNSLGLRLYTHDQYLAARHKAVQVAREGNRETALTSLERLLKLEPDNNGALNDYITILIWDEQYEEALAFLPRLDIDEIPEYVLRSLIIAADEIDEVLISEELVESYFSKFPIVPDNTPYRIKGKTAYEIARLSFNHGMTLTSLSILKLLHERHPKDQRILAGYAAVLGKDQQHRKSLELIQQMNLGSAPEFALDSLIESARQLGEKEVEKKLLAVYQKHYSTPSESTRIIPVVEGSIAESISLQKGSTPKPTYTDHLGLVQKYLNEKKLEKAESALLPLYLKGLKDKDFLIVVTRLFDAQKKYMEAAFVYQQLLEFEPENVTFKRSLVLNLFYAGAPFRAQEILQEDPTLLSETEVNKIVTDTKAILFRWSRYTQSPGTNPTTKLDRILVEINSEIARLQGGTDSYNLNRLQMDYIVALKERNRNQEVVSRYSELLALGRDFPDYVLQSVASAFLNLEQPEQSRDIYLHLLQKNPDNINLKIALFYAYFDCGDYQKGLDLAIELDAETPLWRKDHTGGIVKNNLEKVQASILVANGLAYTDDLGEAQIRYEQMLATAPYNIELRNNLAMVYRWRGWLQKANEEINIGKTIDPANLYLAVNRINTLLELYRFKEAEQELDVLVKLYPDNRQVAQIYERYHIRDKRQFITWIDGGSSDADASDQGSSDFTTESYLYEKYHAYYLRPFIHQYYTKSNFEEGTGKYQRLGVGTEYKRNRNVLGVELSASYSGDSDTGISLRGDHEFGDQLRFAYGYESFSTQIPVRAYFHDITGAGYRASGVYRLHEATQLTASIGYLDFSDTNERMSLSLSMEQRLMNFPRFKMIAVPSIYQSQNSRDDTPYFNPEEDRTINLSIRNEWLTYHRYHSSFKQILEFSIGQYYQKGFGSNSIDAVVYQHQWDIDELLSFSYGMKMSHNYYDGDKEQRLAGFASLSWLF